MTPAELSEALQIARETKEDAVYSRRVLAKAVLWMQDRHERYDKYINDLDKPIERRIPNAQ